MSIKTQAIQGTFYGFLERFGELGVKFALTIILARLLAPEDFGILGMLAIFTALAQSVVQSGFGQALIQNQNATHLDESTVFWFNLFSGVLMTGALFVAAPWIAAFYRIALLEPVTQICSFNLTIFSLAVVPNTLLVKKLEFKKRMRTTMAAALVAGAVSILMAWSGYGVWALVINGLVASLVTTVGLWGMSNWRPELAFSMTSLKKLWRFGSKLFLSGILDTLFNNLYSLIIGRIYSAAELGLYGRSKNLVDMTATTITRVVGQVSFPLFSRIQEDMARMRHAFDKTLQNTLLVVLPMMVGLAVAATNIIYLLLGEKWMACVPYLHPLCVIGALYPFHQLNLSLLKAAGRSDLFFRLELIKKALFLINIAILWRYGVQALLWGQAVFCSIPSLVVNTYYTKKMLDYGLWAQIKSARKIILSSGLMGLAVWPLGAALNIGFFYSFMIQVISGVFVYMGLLWLVKEHSFLELVSIGMDKLKMHS